ncbi:MAG: PQQ-binding-like beta-propeller repeat protein [Planctomycetes bacterium]|nr:PQQ-binding-like beta-propeller repeat protein [Planctomycetota bacterium]
MVKRSVILAAAVLMLAGAPLAQQEDDGIFVDEVKKEFLEKVARYVEAKDWKGVFDCYAVALTKYRSKLVRPDPAASSWCSVVEHLNLEFGKLPADAFEYYRIENDGRARAVYEQAVKNDDRRALEGIVDGFFFSSVTDEVLDTLGNRYFEEGRPQVAVHFWRKLLEQYPDSDIPRPVTAARIATAARAWGNERVLDDLKRIVAKRGIEGELRAGGRRMPLSEFLRDITIPQAVAAKEFAELPTIPEGAGRFERKGVGVRNEVKRWSFDLSEAVQAPGRGRPRINPNLPQATLRPEFPYLPSYVRLGNREMILVTHGQRVYAVDPTRAALEEDKKEACFYWRYPSKSEAPIKRGGLDSNLAGYFSTTMPYFGVTVEGDIGFATLYSEKKIPEGGPNNQDVFQGSCRLRAFKLLDGEEVWDTDREELHALYRKLEFYDRNWSFSGPPLVKGDRLYAGICTSPIGESESRVVCIDRRTGEPLWVTFLGSVPNRGNPFFSGGGRFVTYLTMLTEEGGVLYAHTNIGIVAALHSVTGHVLWLSKYPRLAGRGEQIARGEVMPEIRPANPVLLHRGRVYVLPQDQMEWQVFDMTTGERLQVPVPRRVEAEIQWRNIQQMLGIVDDWMILGGAESHVVNLVDRLNEKGEVRTPVYRAHSMVSSNVSKCGRGIIVDEMVYLPTCGDAVGALHIYQGIGSWRIVDQTKWQEPNEYGNLLVAGDYLVVTTQAKVLIYTDEATIDREFAHRLAQSPPNPAAFLEHGDIMGLNERLSKAAESYLAFVRAAEGDPQWEHKVREVKIKLHGIFMRRGDEAAASTDPHVQQRAIEDFTMAQQFAHDENTLADATRRLAESYERLASAQKGTAEGKTFARKAVEEYQKIIEKSRDSYHKPDSGDLIQKMWAYAGERIRELKKDFGDDVYEPVEEAAREALAQVKEGSAEALRKVTELYPDTKAARQAWDRLVEQLEKEGDFKKLLSALREM